MSKVTKYLKKIRKYVQRIQYIGWKKEKYNNIVSKETILVISHSTKNGGAPLLAKNIVEKMLERGIQVIVITRDYGELLIEFSKLCEVYVCLNDFELLVALKKIKKYQITTCYCNSVMTGDWVKKIKRHGYRVITLIHELPYAIKTLNAENWAVEAARFSDVVIFPSLFVRNKFLEIVSSIYGKELIRPQGLFLKGKSLKYNKESSKIRVESIVGKQLKEQVVLNVGESSYRKGYDLFIELAEKDPGRTYIWVGYKRNKFTDDIHRNKSLPTNLHLVGYVSSEGVLYDFYYSADILALTSREEPFGSIVLEAFNTGIPVVGFDNVGGFIDIVKNGETGILVKELKSDEMLLCINCILKDKSIYKKMSDKCKAISKSNSFDEYITFLLSC